MAVQLFQIAAKALIRDESGKILMVRIPAWSGNAAHWDLPGGRMNPGEDVLDTLRREILEEVGCSYIGIPRQLMAFLTNITIPLGDVRVPLLFIVYEVSLGDNAIIQLDPDSAEEAYEWFTPLQAS